MTESFSIGELAERTGLRRVHIITWRDIDHEEAGGSELHINAIADQWSSAGIDVIIRTSGVANEPRTTERNGYRVIRKGNSLSVLVRNPIVERFSKDQEDTGLVEVWHGINFLAPLWSPVPRIAIAHHVHGSQFRKVLPPPFGHLGEQLERHVYPRLYRKTEVVTLSESSRRELLELNYEPHRVHIASPGISPNFCPDPTVPKSPSPMLVVVARLMPQKHVEVVIQSLAELHEDFPELSAVVVGEGPQEDLLRKLAGELGVSSQVQFAGRVEEKELIDLYRRSWLLVSASSAEGWGMTITEAAACGTPAVATRIAGHVDAISENNSGLLADSYEEFKDQIAQVIRSDDLRKQLGDGALEHSRQFTWTRCAYDTLMPLANQMTCKK